MKRGIASLVFAVFCGVYAAAAAAQSEWAGWYLGLDVGYSDVDLTTNFWIDSDRSTGEIDTQGLGFQVFAGYRLGRHLAIEGGYLRAGETVFRGQTDGFNSRWRAGAMEGVTKIQGFSTQALALWPLWQSRVTLHVRGGLLFWDTTTHYDSTINDINRFNDDGVSPIVGLGADVLLWRKWRLRAGWQYSIVNLEDRFEANMHMATLGVTRFLP